MHNLNIVGGRAAFFSKKEKAWHGLGQIVEEAPTSEEAIKLAGLDYEVGLAPLKAQIEASSDIDGTPLILGKTVEGRYATYRKDTKDIFGIVGSRYEVVQNKDAFSFFDAIVGDGEAIYETAGALGQGETVFITAKLPDYIKVQNEDIEKYLLLTMAHDGSASIQALFTPIRIVCNNTLNAALSQNRGKKKVTVRHTRSAHDNLKKAHEALGISNMLADELAVIFNQMALTKVNDNVVENYILDVFCTPEELKEIDERGGSVFKGTVTDLSEILSTRKQNILGDVHRYYYGGVGQDTITCRDTAFGLYNAVTGYYQNVKKYSDTSKKMESNILGANAVTMQKAMDKAFTLSYA